MKNLVARLHKNNGLLSLNTYEIEALVSLWCKIILISIILRMVKSGTLFMKHPVYGSSKIRTHVVI